MNARSIIRLYDGSFNVNILPIQVKRKDRCWDKFLCYHVVEDWCNTLYRYFGEAHSQNSIKLGSNKCDSGLFCGLGKCLVLDLDISYLQGRCKDCKISQGTCTRVCSSCITQILSINNYNGQNCLVKLKINFIWLYIFHLLWISKKRNLSSIYRILSILHRHLIIVIEYTCTTETFICIKNNLLLYKKDDLKSRLQLSDASMTQSVRVKSFKHLDDSDKSIPLVFMSWHRPLSILSILISITIGHCVLWAIKKSYFKFTLTLLADNAWNKVLSSKKMWKLREKKERITRPNTNINVVIYKLTKLYT